MPGRGYIVTVYDVKIEALFLPGGQVNRPIQELQREIVAEAAIQAPKRSGELAASHRSAGALKAGRYRLQGRIENTSDHARYVHEGTTGPIFPTRGQFMLIPPGNGFGFSRVESVRGQAANPWMVRAGRTVLSRHGI